MYTIMKKFTLILSVVSLSVLSLASFAQTVYNVNSDITWRGNGAQAYPNPCFNCTFNIADGVTLTLERDVTFQNVTINGGNVVVEGRRITLWTSGGLRSNFNNTNFIFKAGSGLTGSAPINITNSEFEFRGNSFMNPQQALNVTGSHLKFLDNAYFDATGTPVDLRDNSSLTAGDGSLASRAYIRFNGPMLNVHDNSQVNLLNKNNYYFNWNPYTSRTQNRTISTTNNNFNCGSNGVNSCSAPMMYGPSSINGSGFVPYSILPVKLISFDVKLNNKDQRQVSWTTAEEINSLYFQIERSFDGTNWEAAAKIDAKGQSNAQVNYSYTDASPVNGAVYYRLKMIDIDGSFTYSAIRNVSVEAVTSVSVFPNPALSSVSISVKASATNLPLIRVLNQHGQVVKSVNATSTTTRIAVSDLAAGVYHIQVIHANGTFELTKIQVVK